MEEERDSRGDYDYRRGRDREPLDLTELFRVIGNRWKFIAVVSGSFTVLTLIVSFLLTPIYRSTAIILPINKSIPSLIEGSGLSSLIGLIGMDKGSNSSTIMAILKGNSIKEKVILNHQLMKVLFEDEWDEKNNNWKDEPPHIWEGIRELDDIVRIEEERKTGAISISTDFKDPNIASDISNWIIEEVSRTLQEKSFSIARHQRVNIEEILASLKGHLKIPEGDLPDISLFMRKMRDLEISEKAYEELLVQYYLAKFQEAKEDVVFQVIDEAKPMDKPAKPRKLLNTLIGLVVSLLLSAYYTVITERRDHKRGEVMVDSPIAKE
ncbi:MAG: hypothetical protein GTN76_09960 [Candidatus Aenigmarchaeota archaeon]|nr:hypothetical protein [Candidatus Aenigmarchaeota archaeon]